MKVNAQITFGIHGSQCGTTSKELFDFGIGVQGKFDTKLGERFRLHFMGALTKFNGSVDAVPVKEDKLFQFDTSSVGYLTDLDVRTSSIATWFQFEVFQSERFSTGIGLGLFIGYNTYNGQFISQSSTMASRQTRNKDAQLGPLFSIDSIFALNSKWSVVANAQLMLVRTAATTDDSNSIFGRMCLGIRFSMDEN